MTDQRYDRNPNLDTDPNIDAVAPLPARSSSRSMPRARSAARSMYARPSTSLSPQDEDARNGIRYIQLNHHELNARSNFVSNQLRTAKYTPINMIPKALFEQFRRFANFYFLVIACISFIDGISPSTPFANVLPLFIVVGFGFARDVYEDIQRSIEDSRQNNTPQIVMDRAPSNDSTISKHLSPISRTDEEDFIQLKLDPEIHRSIPSKNIAVGDIVFVRKGHVFPCDLVLLHSSGEGGVAYVSTANLDGESNLKRVVVTTPTSEISKPEQLRRLEGKVKAQKPTTALHEFEASLTLSRNNSINNNMADANDGENRAPLDASNLMLRGSILRNTEYIYGLAVYTGFDTKVALNMRNPPSKMGMIERKLNHVVVFLFIVLAVLVIGFSITAGVLQAKYGEGQWYMGSERFREGISTFSRSLGTFLILFSTFIPVSLFVTLEFIRLLQALFMAADFRMKTRNQKVVARATNLNEMLGEVEHILSDKTGTLTENVMRYVACSTNGTIYHQLKQQNAIEHAIQSNVESVKELVLSMALCHSVVPEPKADSNATDNESGDSENKRRKLFKKKKNGNGNGDVGVNVGVNGAGSGNNRSNTIPEVRHEGALEPPSEEDSPLKKSMADITNGLAPDDLPEYQGQSPDEVALVTSAREYGITLLTRSLDTMTLNHFGIHETYTMLAELEFNSDRKRMSMILRCPDGRITMYTKGADTIMLGLLNSETTDLAGIQADIDEFAKEGLRTLVFARKELSEEVFNEWFERFQQARNSLEDREELVSNVSKEIETDLEYIATTAVEDKLQNLVPETIKFMREAEVKLWVLTGDKRETAENIGYSANLLDRKMDVVHIQGSSSEEVESQLRDILAKHTHGGDVTSDERLSQNLSFSGLARRVSELVSPRRIKAEEKEVGIIIDGASLKFALEHHDDLFMQVSDHTKVVICARVTPLQKALVVRLVKTKRQSLTLAVGDGGNDVSMIQEAHIGVGIFGKEGTQAARSADYAIGEFKHLLRLTAVHGRYSSVRTAGMINLSFYKNIFFTMTQVFFQIFDFATGLTYNNQWITSAFNVVVTSASPFLFGIFERDVDESTILHFPSMYSYNRDRRLFSLRTAIEYTMVYGLWHAFIVFFGVYLTFGYLRIGFPDGKDSGLVLAGFVNSTIIVFMTLFKIMVHSHTLNWIVLLAIALSIGTYFVLIPIFIALPVIAELDLEGQLHMMFSSPTFYLCSFVIFVAAFVLDFSILVGRQVFKPNMLDRVQMWERKYRKGNKNH